MLEELFPNFAVFTKLFMRNVWSEETFDYILQIQELNISLLAVKARLKNYEKD